MYIQPGREFEHFDVSLCKQLKIQTWTRSARISSDVLGNFESFHFSAKLFANLPQRKFLFFFFANLRFLL